MQAKDIVRITGEAIAEAERLPNVEEIIASSAYGDPILDVNLLEDAPPQTVGLAGIGAGPFESQPLTVTAASGSTGVVPHPTVSYTNPNPTGSLSFTPVPDAVIESATHIRPPTTRRFETRSSSPLGLSSDRAERALSQTSRHELTVRPVRAARNAGTNGSTRRGSTWPSRGKNSASRKRPSSAGSTAASASPPMRS